MQKMKDRFKISPQYSENADVVLFNGECLDLLKQIPDEAAMLVVTSPPYNLGKEYDRRIPMSDYVKQQSKVIAECVRILHKKGSICWQVGMSLGSQEILPLDILLYKEFKKHGFKLRNRIIWYHESGLHCYKRFSGRHETILWFTRGKEYVFNLDPVRVPRKYPAKKHKTGKKKGLPWGHALGKNPGDVWLIPKVSNRSAEKTKHPCQYPVCLIERLILSLTNKGDLVADPFIGSGTTAIASVLHGRKCAGADKVRKYIDIARQRVAQAHQGALRYQSLQDVVHKEAKFNRSYSSVA